MNVITTDIPLGLQRHALSCGSRPQLTLTKGLPIHLLEVRVYGHFAVGADVPCSLPQEILIDCDGGAMSM